MNTKTSNRSLHNANKAKNDEFYTLMPDIEDELKHYKSQFRGKVVFCNCDDPFESNFFKFFASNFVHWGLKQLIATSYNKSPIAGTQLSLFEVEGLKPDGKQPFKIEINDVPDCNGDGAIDLTDVQYLLKHDKNTATPLTGIGDFRSDESVELLKRADIVCTNPPFSLFREYIAQLTEYGKKFLIVGNKNSVKYNIIFKIIKENKLWLGYRNINKDMWLRVPDDVKYEKIVDGMKVKHIMACWLTNLETTKRHEHFAMYKKYKPETYPKYDNYDAIEVSKVTDIPLDYEGEMGVPITFIDKYNPDQFLLIGIFDDKREKSDAFIQGVPTYVDEQHKNYVGPVVNGKALYTRILVKNKKAEKLA